MNNILFGIGYFRRGEEVLAISSPASSIVPKESIVRFPELLPSGIHDEPSHGARKYLRRETDIPADDVRQNPSQGRIAGRIVRTCIYYIFRNLEIVLRFGTKL